MARSFPEQSRLEELAEAARYNTNELAKGRNVSPRQLRRQFQRHLGRSPQDWLEELRLIRSQHLLLSGLLVKQVVLDLGFKQTSHFCRWFKARNKMTPSEFVASQFASQKMSVKDNKCPRGITSSC